MEISCFRIENFFDTQSRTKVNYDDILNSRILYSISHFSNGKDRSVDVRNELLEALSNKDWKPNLRIRMSSQELILCLLGIVIPRMEELIYRQNLGIESCNLDLLFQGT